MLANSHPWQCLQCPQVTLHHSVEHGLVCLSSPLLAGLWTLDSALKTQPLPLNHKLPTVHQTLSPLMDTTFLPSHGGSASGVSGS
jgi:hypothetical protein